MILLFTKNHSPRKKGDVVEFKTRDELRTANWYLANSIAEIASEEDMAKAGCPDCESKKKEAVKEVVVKEVVTKVIEPKATTKKDTTKKKGKK